MIRAFARFAKKVPKSKFIIVSWSVDEQHSKALANTLGLSDKIIWIKPIHKNLLIQYYNAADVVLDQFVLGSWGTSTPEAMACGKPVITFYKQDYILRAFGEEPPILNSFTEDDIYSNLLKLAQEPELLLILEEKVESGLLRRTLQELLLSDIWQFFRMMFE